MIKRSDLLSINFYKKSAFTGSDKNLRFRISKDTIDDTDVLSACVFPGPYAFDSTDESLKTYKVFEFSDKGLDEIVEWFNSDEISEKIMSLLHKKNN